MAQPTQSDLHVDRLLTNLSIGYSNMAYIADRIFPLVRVMKRSDLLPMYDQSHWFRDEAKLRATGTKAVRGGYTVTNDTYYCHRYSFAKEVYDEDRDNTDAPYNLDLEAVEFVTDKLQMRREAAFATDFFTTSVWGTDKTGGTDFTAWSDFANSSPLVDITGWNDLIEGAIGRMPTQLVLGRQAWNGFKWHPDFIDNIKYTQRGQLSVDLFAAMAEIPQVLIGTAIQTTTGEGTAEASVTYTRIWGKHGLLLYVPPAPSLRTPAAGYTFVWERVPSAIQYMKRLRDEDLECDVVEGNSYFDQKVTGAKAGVFLSGLVA